MSYKDQLNLLKLPRHIAIIMDGNGRWAKEKGKLRVFGHHSGVLSVRDVVEGACDLDLGYLTLYTFSSENWNRPKLEVILAQQTRPDGTPIYTALTGITLMVFYVFALQCVSTVAVVRRETNSWKWPLFQWFYMGALAWGLAFLTYQGGRLLGWH